MVRVASTGSPGHPREDGGAGGRHRQPLVQHPTPSALLAAAPGSEPSGLNPSPSLESNSCLVPTLPTQESSDEAGGVLSGAEVRRLRAIKGETRKGHRKPGPDGRLQGRRGLRGSWGPPQHAAEGRGWATGPLGDPRSLPTCCPTPAQGALAVPRAARQDGRQGISPQSRRVGRESLESLKECLKRRYYKKDGIWGQMPTLPLRLERQRAVTPPPTLSLAALGETTPARLRLAHTLDRFSGY